MTMITESGLPAEHAPQAHEGTTPFDQSLTEAEALVNDIKRVLVKSEHALENEGVKSDMETLERWMESYRRGLAAANKISVSGPEILSKLKDRLKLAVAEQQRFEDEGNNPITGEQAQLVEEMLSASRRLERLIPSIEHVFTPCGEPEEEKVKEEAHA